MCVCVGGGGGGGRGVGVEGERGADGPDTGESSPAQHGYPAAPAPS